MQEVSPIFDNNKIPVKKLWQVIIASSVGTVIEWYDFYIFGSLATIISSKFFPSKNSVSYPFCRIISIVFFAINTALPLPAKGFTKNKMVLGDGLILEQLFLKDKITNSKSGDSYYKKVLS